MKIKTITCHHVYNYGATLQAYALQHYLEELGHEVEIIDYRLPTHVRYELFTPYPEGMAYNIIKKIPFLRFFVTPYKNRKMLSTWGRKKSFDDFDKKFLHISKGVYRTYEELRKAKITADVFIAGSDQIWNPIFINGTDPGYYLDFGDRGVKRISYAASFGVSEICDKQADFVKEKLSSFSHLSVRELSGVEILRKIGLKAVKCVDPVFLLNKDEWGELKVAKRLPYKYIMVYDFHHEDENMIGFVKRLSKEKGLKVLSINDTDNATYADIQINDAGPREFLSYIENADFVVGNSFHATAFSLIFNKRFATFPLKTLPNKDRMVDLIHSVGLDCFYSPTHTDALDKDICWEEVNKLLCNTAHFSKEYLHIALGNY